MCAKASGEGINGGEGLSEDKDTAAGSEDDLVECVYLYLKDNAYPKQSSVSLKRQIRLR